jgi:hypothetical protein
VETRDVQILTLAAETKSDVSALAFKEAQLLPFQLTMFDLVKPNRVFDCDQTNNNSE